MNGFLKSSAGSTLEGFSSCNIQVTGFTQHFLLFFFLPLPKKVYHSRLRIYEQKEIILTEEEVKAYLKDDIESKTEDIINKFLVFTGHFYTVVKM